MNDRILARVRRRLAAIPQLAAHLPLFTVTGFTQPDPGGPGGTVAGSRPPLNLEVLDLADPRLKDGLDYDPRVDVTRRRRSGVRRVGVRRVGVWPTLLLWGQLLTEEMVDVGYSFGEPDDDSLAGLCAWLAFHSEWICEHHDDFDTQVGDLYQALRGEPDENPTCPLCGWEVEPKDGGSWFRCRGCERTWARDAERTRLQREAENYVPLSYASKVLDTPTKTLHYWVGRGWIADVGRDRRGRLYDLRALAELRAQVEHGKPRSPGT